MQVNGSIIGWSDGGSVMLASTASCAARRLASSLFDRDLMYQTRIISTGAMYRVSSRGVIGLDFLECCFVIV